MAIQKSKEKEQNKKSSSSFKEQVKAIISKPVLREVKLRYQSCCGCGCHDVTVKRKVAFDSEYEDGDTIDVILEDDELLD